MRADGSSILCVRYTEASEPGGRAHRCCTHAVAQQLHIRVSVTQHANARVDSTFKAWKYKFVRCRATRADPASTQATILALICGVTTHTGSGTTDATESVVLFLHVDVNERDLTHK